MLLSDFYHDCFFCDENIIQNYLPTQDGVWVSLCLLIFYQAYDNFAEFYCRCSADICKNVDITLAEVIAKITVVEVIVIFLPDVHAMMYMRSSCHAYLLLFFYDVAR